MAVPLPPPMQEEEALKNSVMRGDPTPFQRLVELLMGKGLQAQWTSGLVGGVGNIAGKAGAAKIPWYEQVSSRPLTAAGRGVRVMPHEEILAIVKQGQPVDLNAPHFERNAEFFKRFLK